MIRYVIKLLTSLYRYGSTYSNVLYIFDKPGPVVLSQVLDLVLKSVPL